MSKNIRLFIAFRLLFNARFYYPIFAVLQLDYGLTMEQFALLNFVWAVSIVLLEVPSGALADKIGRKRMVVAAAVLMILEMALIAFVPLGNTSLVFWAWVLNRILSGAAEAAASGADEALAYDSLPEENRESLWPKVLANLMRLSSIAFVVAMLVGAAIYDPDFINRIFAALGSDFQVTKEQTLRFPVYLTLFTGCLALIVSISMKEPPQDSHHAGETTLWSGIFRAAAWVWKTPVVFAIILAALIHDSVVRLFLTLNSEYYRLIKIPDAAFGVLGAVFAALGIITPGIAKRLVEKQPITRNYLIVSALCLVGLLVSAQAIPYYGVVVLVIFSFAFGFLNFFTSHYLNAQVDSYHRATVLSFRGLALNIGFGTLSLAYGFLLRQLGDASHADNTTAFRDSLHWFAPTFLVMLVPLVLYYLLAVKRHTSTTP
ncbi:MAG: MFS transporter [Verrucomicrobiota bacterium]